MQVTPTIYTFQNKLSIVTLDAHTTDHGIGIQSDMSGAPNVHGA